MAKAVAREQSRGAVRRGEKKLTGRAASGAVHTLRKGTTVRARIEQHIKDEAELVLEAIGIDTSTAFRLLMHRIAKEKVLPFELHKPNEETLEALRELRDGQSKRFESINDLMADLNADD